MATALRRTGAQGATIKQITGHQKQGGDSFGVYDHGETLERLAEVIEQVDFGISAMI